MDNMLLAQKHLNDMLQLSPSKERLQMLRELQALKEENQMLWEVQALKEENQMLAAEVQKLKTQRVEELVVPRPVQELYYQYVLVGVHNMFIFYQEHEEKEDINEMDQPLQDLPPSPLSDPHE